MLRVGRDAGEEGVPLSGHDDRDARARRNRGLFLGLTSMTAATLLLGIWMPREALDLLLVLWQSLLAAPAPVFFGVMSVALVFPVPISAFYVAAGPIFGILPALAWIAPSLVLNALLVHAIGTTAVRPRLLAWIEQRGLRVPTLNEASDQLLFATVVRVTPGIPYFIQSWLIVLAGIRRDGFVALSVGIQMFYAAGFVTLGRSAFEGRLGLAVTALTFLLVATLVARQVHRRLRDRAPTFDEDPE